MSISIHATLIVGFKLNSKELLEERSVGSVCPLGHNLIIDNAVFCSECGTKCVKNVVREPTEIFKRFCKKFEFDNVEEAFDALVEGDLKYILHKGVFGRRLCETHLHKQDASVSMQELEEITISVLNVRELFGKEDRGISIHLNLLAS